MQVYAYSSISRCRADALKLNVLLVIEQVQFICYASSEKASETPAGLLF